MLKHEKFDSWSESVVFESRLGHHVSSSVSSSLPQTLWLSLCTPWRRIGECGTTTTWRFVVGFALLPFSPGETTLGTHWIGVWVGRTAGLEPLENNRCFVPTGNKTKILRLGQIQTNLPIIIINSFYMCESSMESYCIPTLSLKKNVTGSRNCQHSCNFSVSRRSNCCSNFYLNSFPFPIAWIQLYINIQSNQGH